MGGSTRATTAGRGRCLIGGAVLMTLGSLAGCYPGGIESFSETDIVATIRVPEVDYQANKTFAMPDEVIDLCDLGEDVPDDITGGADCRADKVTHQFDAHILSTIRRNFENRGYTLEDDPENNKVDVVALAGIAVTDRYTYSYYCDWWWYYWGWWGGWGPYPPASGGGGWYCPAVPAVTAYTVGSLFITMVNPDDVAEDAGRLPMQWNAVINGLAGSNANTTQQRITRTIDQAFSQSPYLDLE